MTLVVSDTSPINYLVLIKAESVLPRLYGSILVPSQVVQELNRDKTPESVRSWAQDLPIWLHVQVGDASRFPSLGYGEAAALALAVDASAQLLVDEADARSVADSLGVPTIGTVGILVEAHLKGLIDFDSAIADLRATTFRIHDSVIAAARLRIVGPPR